VSRYEAGEIGTVDVLETFMHVYPYREWPLGWFDSEMRDVFGIDVYATEFPKERGYDIYQEGGVELLVIRVDDLDRCAEEAFSEFLGIDGFKPVNKNRAENKPYARAYTDFKAALAFSDGYLERFYEHEHTRHFYSPSEIQEFMVRWAGK
jgi:hypothetical protein